MAYDFLSSYSSFDYSCRLENEAFIHCKYDTYTILEDEKLLLFSYGGKTDPIAKLIINLAEIKKIKVETISQNFDILKLKHEKEDIVLYCHK